MKDEPGVMPGSSRIPAELVTRRQDVLRPISRRVHGGWQSFRSGSAQGVACWSAPSVAPGLVATVVAGTDGIVEAATGVTPAFFCGIDIAGLAKCWGQGSFRVLGSKSTS